MFKIPTNVFVDDQKVYCLGFADDNDNLFVVGFYSDNKCENEVDLDVWDEEKADASARANFIRGEYAYTEPDNFGS